MSAHTQEVFDPAAYPRTYGLSVFANWFVSLLGLGLVSLGLAGINFLILADEGRTPAGSAILGAFCGGFALMGIYLLAVVIFYRVTLQADSIEVFEIYRRRQLRRGEIAGRSHFANARGPSAWVLMPKPGFGGTIKLSMYLKTDKDFLAWIHSLPDLDPGKARAAERERTEAITALKNRGFSDLSIQRLRGIARGLNFATYGLGLATFLVSDPHHLLTWTLIAMPWVGILLVAHFAPYFRFGGPRNSSLPDLSLVLITPGLFLTLSALQRMTPIGREGPSLLTALGSALLVGVAFWYDPWLRKHLGTIALLLLLGCAYGYGAGMHVNALLDRSTAESYRVLVIGKNVSHGRSTTYQLKLAPWGPKVRGQDLTVPYSRYASTKPGDTVCMLLRSGALGVAWSEPGSCDAIDEINLVR
jgi:hypothetical protein